MKIMMVIQAVMLPCSADCLGRCVPLILSMSEQARTFFILIGAGIAAGFVYDIIRILRRIARHGLILIQIEDLLYWIILSVFIMLILLWDNNGVLRFFSVIAPVIGMILYFCLISDFIIRPAEVIISIIRKLFAMILHIICLPLRLIKDIILFPVKNCLLKINKIAKNLLKKTLKCEKIYIRFSAFKLRDKGHSRSDRLEKQSKKEGKE